MDDIEEDDVDNAASGEDSRSTLQTIPNVSNPSCSLDVWYVIHQNRFELQKLNISLREEIHGVSNAGYQETGYYFQEEDHGDRDIHHPVAEQREELNPHRHDSFDEAEIISIADSKKSIHPEGGRDLPPAQIVDAQQEQGPSFSNTAHAIAPSGSNILNFITFILTSLCYDSQSRSLFTGSWSRSLFTGSWSRSLFTGSWSRSLFTGSWSRSLFTGSWSRSLFPGSWSRSLFTGSWSRSLFTGSWSRSLFPGSESRSLFTGSESRSLFTGSRSLFPGSESRSLFPGSESRSLLTGSESRSLLTGSESRSLLTGSESRSLLTGSESRSLLTGSESRSLLTGSESRSLFTGSESRSLLTGSESTSVNTEMNNAAGSHAYCFGNAFVRMNALYGYSAVPVLHDSAQMAIQSFENDVASNDDGGSDNGSNESIDGLKIDCHM